MFTIIIKKSWASSAVICPNGISLVRFWFRKTMQIVYSDPESTCLQQCITYICMLQVLISERTSIRKGPWQQLPRSWCQFIDPRVMKGVAGTWTVEWWMLESDVLPLHQCASNVLADSRMLLFHDQFRCWFAKIVTVMCTHGATECIMNRRFFAVNSNITAWDGGCGLLDCHLNYVTETCRPVHLVPTVT